MRMMYERCCGLDIHKASIAACALISEKGTPQEETRRFGAKPFNESSRVLCSMNSVITYQLSQRERIGVG